MFKVVHRRTKVVFTVYSVNSEPIDSLFLFFDNDEKYPHWYWDYAEEYSPFIE